MNVHDRLDNLWMWHMNLHDGGEFRPPSVRPLLHGRLHDVMWNTLQIQIDRHDERIFNTDVDNTGMFIHTWALETSLEVAYGRA